MSTLPALNAISTAANQGVLRQALEDFLAGVKQIPGSGIAETTLTLASDAITPPGGSGGIFTVDTEAAAASDNLATITQTNFPDGSCLILRPASSARLVVVKHAGGGSGQILLRTAGDFTLGDTTHWLCLKRTGTSWQELWRMPALPWVAIDTKTGSYTLLAADRGKIIDATSGTWTLGLLAVATAGIGFHVTFRNSGTGVITIDGNSSETIDGATTLKLNPGHEIILVCDGSGWKSVSRYAPFVPQWHLAGMTYSNNGSDATNDIDYAVGQCASDDTVDANRVLLNPGAMTKQLDAVWAAGSAAGGRISSESLADGQWFGYAFRRSGGADDYCFSQSLTPTLPDGGTHKRLMSWIWRASGAIVACHTYELPGGGLELLWDSPTLDINLANTLTTTRQTNAVKVPLSFSTLATLHVNPSDAGSAHLTYLSCPDLTDLAPSTTAAPLMTFNANAVAVSNSVGGRVQIRTSATGTIAARSSLATVDLYAVATIGFQWARRN